MTEFFFPQNPCGIGNKVEKIDFDFVESCDILPTPPPIFDCQLPIIAREPEIPCPTFETSAKIDVGYSGSANCPLEPPSRIEFKIEKLPDDVCPADTSCRFGAEIDISVLIPPPPCPALNVGGLRVTTGFADQPCIADGQNRFQITANKRPGNSCDDPGSCEFVFDLELVVPIPRPPCPNISVNNFYVQTIYNDECKSPPSRFEIKPVHRLPEGCQDTGDCNFEIDLEINVPIPRPPCPEIRITKFEVKSAYDDAPPNCGGQNRFEIRRRYEGDSCFDPKKKEKCEFDIELEIFIPIPKPPCPELNIKNFQVKTFYRDRDPQCESSSKFEITTKRTPSDDCRAPDRCEFEFDLEISVPIPKVPCPTISVGTFRVESKINNGTSNCSAGSKFEITRKVTEGVECDEPDQCDFEVNLEIVVPIPPVPCPTFNIKTFNTKTFYNTDKCANTSGGEPVCPASFFRVTPRTTPSTCDTHGTCDFDIDLQICVPIPPPPPCPEIRIGNFGVNYVEGITSKNIDELDNCNYFTVTRKTAAGECGETTACEFDLDLNICIPIPPCPEFNINSFIVKSGFVDCIAGDNKFEIRRKSGNDDACSFDIDLEIYVPIPRTPCPVFGTNLNVQPFFFGGGCVPGFPPPPCPVGGGGGGAVVGGASWFTVEPVVIGGCCDQGDGQAVCGFLFDLNIAIPIPKLIQEISFDVQKVKFDIEWCTPQLGVQPNVLRLDFKPQPDPWVNCCERGAKAEFKPELEIKYNLPRWPCEFVELWPGDMDFPVELVDSNGVVSQAPTGTYLKLKIEPKPPLGPCLPCRWEFRPELRIPKPCEYTFEYSYTDSVVNPNYYTCYNDFDTLPDEFFEIRFEADPTDRCKFKVWTYAKPNIYKPCEAITYVPDYSRSIILPFYCKSLTEIQQQSSLEFHIEQDALDCCKFNVWYYYRMGVLRPICEGDVYVNGSSGTIGTGTLKCVGSESEGYKYRVDIDIATKTVDVVTNVACVNGQIQVTYSTVTVLA